MSLKKQYLKSKPLCKVTFKVNKNQAGNASSISVLGDFNGWDPQKGEMKPMKDGSFSLSIDLEIDRQYQFRYFTDQQQWLDEPEADDFVHSGIGDARNALLVI